MPSAKTEASELSVAFGLLDIRTPLNIEENQIQKNFSGTLLREKYLRFQNELQRNEDMYARLNNVGIQLRANYPSFNHLTNLQWIGPQQQASTVSSAIDLLAANIPISVKNNSNVVLNPSPFNLFITIPSGNMPASRAGNWYQITDPDGIQNLYTYVRNHIPITLPGTFQNFEAIATRSDRKEIQRQIRGFSQEEKAEFDSYYVSMCHNVAQESADLFNLNLEQTLVSNRRNAVLENIIRQFFRIGGVLYILAGLDHRHSFAMEIPNLTEWKRCWKLINVNAEPDMNRHQSVVYINLVIESKLDHERYILRFHSEIRWSHGKFCGNPESKLYKDFSWIDVPFFARIV